MFWLLWAVVVFTFFIIGYIIVTCEMVNLIKENKQLKKEREKNTH